MVLASLFFMLQVDGNATNCCSSSISNNNNNIICNSSETLVKLTDPLAFAPPPSPRSSLLSHNSSGGNVCRLQFTWREQRLSPQRVVWRWRRCCRWRWRWRYDTRRIMRPNNNNNNHSWNNDGWALTNCKLLSRKTFNWTLQAKYFLRYYAKRPNAKSQKVGKNSRKAKGEWVTIGQLALI